MCVWIEKDYLVLRPYAHIFCRWPMPTSDDHLWFTALQASITPCAGSPTIPSCFKIRTHPSPEINHPKTVPKWTFRLNCRARFLDLSFSWSFSTVVLNQTFQVQVPVKCFVDAFYLGNNLIIHESFFDLFDICIFWYIFKSN